MKIVRCANAGVQIELDSYSFLIDGPCRSAYPYENTPKELYEEILNAPANVVMYTHYHADHYDEGFALSYKQKTLRPIYGPEFPLNGKMGKVTVKALPVRHIGRADCEHVCYILSGSKTICHLGDSSPVDFKNKLPGLRADILIIPYAFASTSSAWDYVKSLNAEKIILLHMPPKDRDAHSIWDAVWKTTGFEGLIIPDICEIITI